MIAVLSSLIMPACSRSPAISPQTAAQLAAELANEQCDRMYQERPFSASQHSAVLQDGVYQWGGFDPVGPGGYSALVSFPARGGAPHVEIYFSCDPLAGLDRPDLSQLPGGLSPLPKYITIPGAGLQEVPRFQNR